MTTKSFIYISITVLESKHDWNFHFFIIVTFHLPDKDSNW